MVVRCYVLPPVEDPKALRDRIASASRDLFVQVVSSGAIDSEELCAMILAQTDAAASRLCLLARRPEMDFLLRVAGTTQISEAVKIAGAKSGKECVLVLSGQADKVTFAEKLLPPGSARLGHRMKECDMDRVERAALLDAARA
jgi:tRNA threonylcarbamoyladenosine modification (KEOPS) complex Cgi121 subunit